MLEVILFIYTKFDQITNMINISNKKRDMLPGPACLSIIYL